MGNSMVAVALPVGAVAPGIGSGAGGTGDGWAGVTVRPDARALISRATAGEIVSKRMVTIGSHSGSAAFGTDSGAGEEAGNGLAGVAVRTGAPEPSTRVTRVPDGEMVGNRIVAFTSGAGTLVGKRVFWFLVSDMVSGLVLRRFSCARFYAGLLC